MSFNREIGTPFTLASLPHPINTTNGRTQAAGVHSISSSKKRKRTEVAVGVDGEGIFIYSVQSPQLVTSYALPPQTSFAIAPYSLYRKRTSKRPSRRFTYAVIQQSSPGEQPQLVCFIEEIQKDATTDTVKSAYTITDTSAGRIIAIDSISVSDHQQAKSDSHDVLVVCDDGRVICLSSDLGMVRWDVRLANLASTLKRSQAVSKIEYAVLTNAKAATAGLLRSRQDIAAVLDPTLEGNSELLELSPVLCTISPLADQQSMLSLFQLKPRSPDLIAHQLPPIKHLSTWQLSAPSSQPILKKTKEIFHLHPSSGTLHRFVDGRLVSYDLSGTIPRLYSDFVVPGSEIGSFQRISPDLILTASAQSFGLFDSRYKSIQALLSVSKAVIDAQDSPRKRKQKELEKTQETTESPSLITYYPETGLAVAVSGHDLIGLQLGGTVARKRVKASSSLLIDAIGKGVLSASTGLTSFDNAQAPKDAQIKQQWLKRTHKLDKYASKGKTAEFERIFAAELGIGLEDRNPDSQKALENGTDSSLLSNGINGSVHSHEVADTADEPLRGWKLPKVVSSDKLRHQHQAIYALSKIFCWKNSSLPEQDLLRIDFFPPNVFQWLLLSGYVTKESIRRAIFEDSSNCLAKGQVPSDGDIVKAIVEFDPSLNILSAVLNHSQFLPAGEVAQAVKVLIQSLDDQPKDDVGPKLLTNDNNLDDEMDVDVVSELEAATHDLDHALSILDNGLTLRSHTLRPALIRLHTFPPPTVISTLRSTLPRRELESLIRLLHSELRNGGWTSQYDFIDPDSSGLDAGLEAPDDQAVAIIASLLCCTLDAIGTGAWLAAVGDVPPEDSSDDIIRMLVEDTAETLNGFWEARYMRGLLSEFLRFSSNSSKSHKPSAKALQKQGKPFAADVAADDTLPMLPLGGKADIGIEKTKLGKGGKREERSAREIGMMISKRVPKYSLERINV